MKKTLTTILGLALLVAVTFGLDRALAARTDAPDEARAEALPVTTFDLRYADGHDVARQFTGTVAARRTVDLVFEGTGRIAELHVREGDTVEAGTPLATLDTEVLEANRAQVAARRERLEAQLAELVAGPRPERIEAARAEIEALEQQFALAVSVRDRREALVAGGSIGPEEFETARAEAKRIAALLSGAEARLAELENGTRVETIAAQRGALSELDASIAALDVQIEKTSLTAPFAGTVAKRFLDEGAYVSSMMPQPALRLVESGALEFRVGLPSDLAVRATADDAACLLRLDGTEVALGTGRLLPVVDDRTRTVTAVFDLDAKSVQARPGDLGRLEFTTRVPEAGAWVPLAALSVSPRGLWSLYALEDEGDGTARLSRLEVEVMRTDGERAYVRGTLDSDLEIVADGTHRVVPGQRVRPVATEDAPR